VWSFLEYNLARDLFHNSELSSQLAVIGYGFAQLGELFAGQSHRYGFLCHFASPLVASPSALAGRAILDRTLANVAQLAQAAA